MKFLNNRYAKVFICRGINICVLKCACPAKGDKLGYVIDDERFAECEFNLNEDAVKAIEELVKQTDICGGKHERIKTMLLRRNGGIQESRR